jgi:hypothetical protein
MDPQYILVVVVVLVMGWFAFGVVYNLRRGDAMLKWMQTGLPRIGERTTFRWLGTSVAELVIERARSPFRRLETLLVLKPRDVFWLTILSALQGRNDIVIFRAQLGTPPLLDLELADPRAWSGRSALAGAARRGWEGRPYRELQLMAPRGLLDLAASTLDRLTIPMQQLSPRYVRLSLRRDRPNLEIHVPFPDHHKVEAMAYFEALQNLARALAERG